MGTSTRMTRLTPVNRDKVLPKKFAINSLWSDLFITPEERDGWVPESIHTEQVAVREFDRPLAGCRRDES